MARWRCARPLRFRRLQAGLEARAPGETPTGLLPNTVAFATALAFPSGLLGPGERRGSLDPVARPERARPPHPTPLGRGRGNPGRGRWPGFLPPPALRGEGRGEGPRDPARSARRARLRQEKASQPTSPPHPGSRQVPAFSFLAFQCFSFCLSRPPRNAEAFRYKTPGARAEA